jgi:hypothetical protein
MFYIEDFCLVVKEGQDIFRRLDFDEPVFETASKLAPAEDYSLTSLMKRSLNSFLYPVDPKPELYLRKLIYLPLVVGEDQLYSTNDDCNDLVRLRLIIGELYTKLAQGQFRGTLSEFEMSRLAAFYIFVFHHDQLGMLELGTV